MITINLRPGQRRKRASGSPWGGMLERVQGLKSRIKDPLMLVAVVSWLAVLGFLAVAYVTSTTQLAALEPDLDRAKTENQRFKTFLAEKRRQEKIRDSLVAQIQTIRSVDGDRYVWPHVLDEVTKALPPYTWLVDLGMVGPTAAAAAAAADSADTTARAPAPRTVAFQINGRTVDIQAYTKFLRQLEASPWLSEVTPVSAQTVVEKERAVTAFTIKAMYHDADSAYIHTVPLSQSVR